MATTLFNFDHNLTFPDWQPLKLQNLQTTFGNISASGDAHVRFANGSTAQQTHAALAIANGSARDAIANPKNANADLDAIDRMLTENFVLQNLQTTFGRIAAAGNANIRFANGSTAQRTHAALAIANGSARNAIENPKYANAYLSAIDKMLTDNFILL